MRSRRLGPVLALVAASGCIFQACSEGSPGETGKAALPASPPPSEVAEALVEALSFDDSLERAAAVASLLARLDEASTPEVVAAFEYAEPLVGDVEWMLLADWWTRFDDRAAYAWVRADRERKTPGMLRYVIRGMTRASPERALLALATLASQEQRDAAFQEIVRAWYETDPAALLDHLVGLVPGRDRQRALSTLVAIKLRREGIPATRDWAERLPDDLPHRFKLQTFRRLASELARVDPAAAQRWAEEHAGADERQGLYRRVAVVTAVEDPEGTLAWLSRLPAGIERDRAVGEAYRRFVGGDREAAMAWMANAPDEAWREPALEVYALALATEDPERALETIARLQDAERRGAARVRVLVSWSARDAEAAAAWLESSDVPDDVRAEIRRRIAQHEERRRQREAREAERELRRRQRAVDAQP